MMKALVQGIVIAYYQNLWRIAAAYAYVIIKRHLHNQTSVFDMQYVRYYFFTTDLYASKHLQ